MNTTAQTSQDGQTRQKRLVIYLNDHLAGVTEGVELARPTAQEHRESPFGERWRTCGRRSRRTGRP